MTAAYTPEDTISPDPIPDTTQKPKIGRPTSYTPEIAAEICRLMAQANSLRTITARADMPGLQTVMDWLSKESGFRQIFRDNIARARLEQADFMADELLDIAATEEDVNRARLMIDARKWYAGKLKPKKYGDIKQIDGQIGVDIKISPSAKPVGAGTSQVEHKTHSQIEHVDADKPG